MKDIVENVLADILDDYAMKDIQNECEIGKERNFTQEKHFKNKSIIKYAAHAIKIDVDKNRSHCQRYDWDSITYKDKEGNLLSFIADYILADDEITRMIAATKVLNQGIENLRLYYKNEFEEKVEEAKESYRQYGSFDYMEA